MKNGKLGQSLRPGIALGLVSAFIYILIIVFVTIYQFGQFGSTFKQGLLLNYLAGMFFFPILLIINIVVTVIYFHLLRQKSKSLILFISILTSGVAYVFFTITSALM